jgi:hypothetical protein
MRVVTEEDSNLVPSMKAGADLPKEKIPVRVHKPYH